MPSEQHPFGRDWLLNCTLGELETLTPEQQRAFYRKLLDLWEKNENLLRHRDFNFDDQRGDEWA